MPCKLQARYEKEGREIWRSFCTNRSGTIVIPNWHIYKCLLPWIQWNFNLFSILLGSHYAGLDFHSSITDLQHLWNTMAKLFSTSALNFRTHRRCTIRMVDTRHFVHFDLHWIKQLSSYTHVAWGISRSHVLCEQLKENLSSDSRGWKDEGCYHNYNHQPKSLFRIHPSSSCITMTVLMMWPREIRFLRNKLLLVHNIDHKVVIYTVMVLPPGLLSLHES
jgi:hypothetical protein